MEIKTFKLREMLNSGKECWIALEEEKSWQDRTVVVKRKKVKLKNKKLNKMKKERIQLATKLK